MNEILTKIVQSKQREIAVGKRQLPLGEINSMACDCEKPRPFLSRLTDVFSSHGAADGNAWGLIAEIKRKSPSKGVIVKDFAPPALARAYQAGGARCLSVLTDKDFFGGSAQDLALAKNACQLPVLRKDFILDPWQIPQSRLMGADCILLILAILDDARLALLADLADLWGMDVLLEVHTQQDLERAIAIDAGAIGINNRNLQDFSVSLSVSENLAPQIPEGRLIISESGIDSHRDICRLSKCNVRCFLVGESLLRSRDVEVATRALLRGSSIAA